MSDKPTTRTVSITDIADELPHLIGNVARHETHVVIEQDGQPVAAIIAIDDFRRLALGTGKQEWEETTRSLQRVSDAFTDVPLEELEARIDAIISAGRRRPTSA
jgi:antitoxin (DNA-binding transcriptional repressor) of toxin-antitoxin stability system